MSKHDKKLRKKAKKAAADVAIVGLALRFPGADDLDGFWDILKSGRSMISEVPPERWRSDGAGRYWGAFLEHADCFDAPFFSISPREAQTMDPQQRFMLELSWKAIEDAGYAPPSLAGSRTGVFMGVCHWDYAELFEKTGLPVDAYLPTGTAYSVIANRVSYFYDFTGPSVANDTACASALVAVQQAVQALRAGECTAALAGAANLCWSPNHFIAFGKNGMLSKTGHSRAFDRRADGYVRGEGAAVLLLKTLRQALADGDRIHAVIKGVGSNHGGHTTALTVTSPRAQAALIHDVHAAAGIHPNTVGYIEAHGTGTPVGDPIEVLGLKTAFARLYETFGGSPEPGHCGIGSVKTNIGHLEGAAGIAGIIKVIAAMRHGMLPPNVDFDQPNPMLKLDGTPFRIVDRPTPWQDRGDGTPRRAGVSAFGFGGSNAHVVMESFVEAEPAKPRHGPVLVPISARDDERLTVVAERLAAQLETDPDIDMAALAWTLQAGRAAMPSRAAFIAAEPAELAIRLRAFATGRRHGLGEAWWSDGHVADGAEAIAKWLRKGRIERLGPAWVRGAAIDWPRLYPEGPPGRLRLPTYPFARERHWFPPAPTTAAATIHPLLHESRSSFGRQRHVATLRRDAFYLADHIVGGRHVLPGVAAIEMVRAAAVRALDADDGAAIELRDVVWLRPVVAEAETVEIEIVLEPRADGAANFHIRAGDGAVHVQGIAALDAAAPERLDLTDIRSSCRQEVAVEPCYARLRGAAIEHGPAFHALHRIRLGAGVAVAELRLPRRPGLDDARWTSHPVLADAAIQAAVALLPEGAQPGVPFAVDRVRLSGRCPEDMVAIVQAAGQGRYDIALCDLDGTVRVRFDGLATRGIEVRPAATLVLAVPTEVPAPLAAAASIERDTVVLLGGGTVAPTPRMAVEPLVLPTAPDDAAGAEATVAAVMARLQDLLRGGKAARVLVVLPGGHVLMPALTALVASVGLESSRIDGRVIAIDDLAQRTPAALTELLEREARSDERAACCRIAADGTRRVKRFAQCELPAAVGAPWRKDGVYWITGGLGGIGRILAAHMAGAGAGTLVLSGRAPTEAARTVLDGLTSTGAKVEYIPLDVTDAVAVRAAVDAIIARHGRLTGVLHCAGLIRDGLAAGKSAADLAAVLAAKVRGVVNLDIATAEHELDLFVAFSSVASVHGNAGQSDYAAANGFMDGYLAWRRSEVRAGRRTGRSLAVNWPLWQGGGMRLAEAGQAAMARRMGMQPLPSAQAFQALEAALAQDEAAQVAVGYGKAEDIIRFFAEGSAAPTAPSTPVAAPAAGARRPAVVERLRTLMAEVLGMEPQKVRPDVGFDTYGFDSIVAVDMIGRLEADLGTLPKTLFFEYVNLDGVADYLLANHGEALARALTPGPAPAAVPAVEPPPAPFREPAAPALRPARDRHDIAVIGVGGRYPGADDLDGFWRNLAAGRHAFTPIPVDRWPHEQIYFNERDVMGKSTIQTGAFLSGIDAFDPRYFSVSQRDAELMSPEVRLMLQVAVETFEDAGYSRETLQSRFDGDVGVLVGTMSNHYNLYGVQNLLTRGARASGSYTGTLPNAISYYYGLTGPSIFVDTMCSTSSTAVDLAVRLLREGQCRMVLAGGVNLLLHPYNLISSSQEHFTSKTAEVIRSFGLGADGTILGEGVGTVLLKPLADAERDGDNIQAVITGTAMTNAGVRNGFTVPSPAMQAKAVRLALEDAGIDARTISYIETHGSGTKLGDPIEIAALRQAFTPHTSDRGFCAIGSVKSNVAHLLAAAGIVGLTKVLLQLRHGMIAPSLHSEELNPAIDFDASPFVVQRSPIEWRRPVVEIDGMPRTLPRRAGITSIGAGGMNSHMVVEEYVAPEQARVMPARPQLFVFSAMAPAALDGVLARFEAWLGEHSDADLAAVAYTLQVGRTALPCRLALLARDAAGLAQSLAAFRLGTTTDAWYIPDVLAVAAPADGADLAAAWRAGDLATVAQAWPAGARVDWPALWGEDAPRRMSLPTYPFAKIRCWYDVFEDAPSVLNPEAFRRRLHPFVGRNVSDLHAVGFVTEFRIDDLLDYAFRRDGARRIVATFALDAALAAAHLAGAPSTAVLRDLSWDDCDWAEVRRLAIAVEPEGGELRLTLSWENGDGQRFRLFEATCADAEGGPAAALSVGAPLTVMDAAAATAALAEGGLDYGPYLPILDHIEIAADGSGRARILPPPLRQDHHKRAVSLQPELLAAVLQAAQLTARQLKRAGWERMGPTSAGTLHLARLPADVTEMRFALRTDGDGLCGDFSFCDANGTPGATLRDLRFGLAAEIHAATVPAADIAAERGAAVMDVLRRQVAAILKFDAEQIDLKTGFYALGFDSISLAELTDRINTAFSVNLTPALFYECENVEQLAAQVLAVGGVSQGSGRAKPAKRVEARPTTRPAPRRVTATDEPVAVIGFAGRFAGCDDVDAFHALLRRGGEALSDLPLQRYGARYAARIAAADFVKRGGFLADIARFDCDFFNISPVEAERMDPQHRLFLETAWATIENAAYRPSRLPEDTGVFIGVSAHDYEALLQAHGVEADGHVATGTSHAMLANRVSYLLDVHGPSEAIDTACSSSLVAVHRAVEAIRAGRCAMALAGGVNVALSLESFLGPHRAGMLSPDGRCKTFAADADGYVRGEGVGAVLLKPLSAAQRDGDPIHGVIIGSAENHGGRSSSLTAPSTRAQADLIVRAMQGIDPSTIDYVEAHGTGTALGDPVELNALKAAYAKLAEEQGSALAPGRCGIGSAKTNIGHLEAAAGIAGMVKLLLAMRSGILPASLHCERLNPYLELAGSPFTVLREPRAWTGSRRRAAISSFGFGGANAHLVLEAPPPMVPAESAPQPVVVVLSARTPGALEASARALIAALDGQPMPLESIAHTLQVGREPMEERLAVVVDDVAELRRRLATGDGVVRGRVRLIRGFPETKSSLGADPAPDALYEPGAFDSLARHWCDGGSVEWERLYDGRLPVRLPLPGYAFAGERLWLPLDAEPQEAAGGGESNVIRLFDDLIAGRLDVEDASRLVMEGETR